MPDTALKLLVHRTDNEARIDVVDTATGRVLGSLTGNEAFYEDADRVAAAMTEDLLARLEVAVARENTRARKLEALVEHDRALDALTKDVRRLAATVAPTAEPHNRAGRRKQAKNKRRKAKRKAARKARRKGKTR